MERARNIAMTLIYSLLLAMLVLANLSQGRWPIAPLH